MDAEWMLYELESNYLEVVLIPARDQRHEGHYIRAVQYQNADWYRKFCAEYLSGRRTQNAKGRTLIKRRETIRALQKILQGVVDDSVYVERLLDFMEREAKNNQPDVPF
jgi:hypothetical protein